MKISVLDQTPVPAGATAADALRNSLDLARRADRLGYHRYWVAEHHAMAPVACPAPEVLVARIAAETSGIRIGSGGVLLSYYSPLKVAETFRLLHALHPGRIDLGIGRALGADAAEAQALGQGERPSGEVFQEKLAELLGFLHGTFPAGHPFREIRVMPESPGAPPVWLLGSSPASAAAAARMDLPYAFAHFIKPEHTREAIETYRAAAADPRLILGLGVYCADTEAEAQRVYASQRLFRRRVTQGVIAPVPSPEDALAELKTGPDPLADERFEWPRYVVGAPEQVRERIDRMTAALQVDELVVLATMYDHGARLRSYELLAETFGLEERGDVRGSNDN